MVSVTITGDPNWAEIAMLVVQLTAVGAALLAFFQLKTQVRLQREEMHSSLRPLVVVERARYESLPDGWYVNIEVRNIGPGPAERIEISGWPRVSKGYSSPQERREEMDAVRREVDIDAPELLLRLGALGSGQSRVEKMSIGLAVPPPANPVDAYLVYFARYSDVYRNRHPLRPRNEWEAGHVWMDAPLLRQE